MVTMLNNDILLSIECPACLEYMNAPIYVCMTGHSVCQTCWSKLEKCPVCDAFLSSTRNYTLESIGDFIKYPCQNEEFGCTDKYKTADMANHAKECCFRKYSCVLKENCKWEGRLTQLLKHCILRHEDELFYGSPIFLNWDSKETLHQNLNRLMIFENEKFYLNIKTESNIVYIWMQYLGNPQDTNQFGYEVNIYTNEYKNRSITFEDICQCDLIDKIEIMSSGLCPAIPVPLLLTYVDTYGIVSFYISLKRV